MFDRFRGVLPEVTGEGTHLRVPWVQTMHVMDIRTRPRSISSVTGTKGAWPKWRWFGGSMLAPPRASALSHAPPHPPPTATKATPQKNTTKKKQKKQTCRWST